MRKKSTTIVFVFVALACVVKPAWAVTKLTPNEIKTIFANGKPFTSTSPGGAVFTIVLNPEGTATRAPQGSKNPTLGKWRLSDVGYCSTWGKGTENCYTIEKGATSFTVRDSAGKVAARW